MATRLGERAHINAFIDEPARRELERMARENDRSLSAEIRRAITAHVQREASSGAAGAAGDSARRTASR